ARGRLARDREGGVRLRRRRVRLRQVDDDPPAPEGDRADRRPHHRRRPRPRPAQAVEGAAPAPQRRLRVPGLQAAPEPDRLRERRLRAQGAGREPSGDPAQGAGGTEPRRARAQDELVPRRALGRRAAARLDRARLREPPAAPRLRRADREPRPRHLRRDHAAPLPHQPLGDDDPHGHPRPRDGRQDAQARDRPRGRAPRPRRAPRGLRLRMRTRMLVSEALRSLRASASTTLAATMTVLIGMFLLGLLIALGTWVVSWSHHVKKEVIVKVYFAQDASAAQINAVAGRLDKDPRVKKYTFVSKAEALKRMEKRFPDLFKTQ